MSSGPVFPFVMTIMEHPRFFVLWTGMIIFSICCHEYAHAWVALQEGDPTARDLGHLTLNPIRQMGPFSIVLLMLIGFAWGAVPVIHRNFRRRMSRVFVAGAGPLMNGILAIVFLMLYALFARADMLIGKAPQLAFMQFFYIGVMVNILGGLFNLMPVPPLDGWDVWSTLFPPLSRLSAGTLKAIQLIGMVVLILGIGYFWWIAQIATRLGLILTGSPIVNLLADQ